MTDKELDALVKRLRSKSQMVNFKGEFVGWGGPVNPDGPQAADAITTLRTRLEEVEKLADSLEQDQLGGRSEYDNGHDAGVLYAAKRLRARLNQLPSNTPEGPGA